MKKLIKFPDIQQFRQIVKSVSDRTRYNGKDGDGNVIFDYSKKLPTLTFNGTVKLHGTNDSITLSKDGDFYTQSKENILSIDDDNMGFCFFVESNKDKILNLIKTIDFQDADYITIFGEWCGSNIQKGVAINGLPKMFVIFDVKLSYNDITKTNFFLTDSKIKHLKNPEINVFNILDFDTYKIEIDFNNPKESQNKLIEYSNNVENECPVGKYFGKYGIGEGIVWKCFYNDVTLRFKVKGKKHSSSKVKTLATVDTEKINSIKDFVEYSVTESRLNQAIEKVFTSANEEIDIKKLGDFLRWINNDIIKEELDTLTDNKLEPKDVNKAISFKARTWFLDMWENFK